MFIPFNFSVPHSIVDKCFTCLLLAPTPISISSNSKYVTPLKTPNQLLFILFTVNVREIQVPNLTNSTLKPAFPSVLSIPIFGLVSHSVVPLRKLNDLFNFFFSLAYQKQAISICFLCFLSVCQKSIFLFYIPSILLKSNPMLF